MEDKIIEINELEKTLTGFQNVPKGDEKTAYVFFQSKDNGKYTISTEKRKIMAAELRIGKYDRIMTIHRGEFEAAFKKEIHCEEESHSFFVKISVRYFIEDPGKIYQEKIYQVSDEIGKSLADIERELNQKYGFRKRASLMEALNQLIEERLGELPYLRCSFGVEVEVDDIARMIIEEEQKHEVEGVRTDLSAIEEQTKMGNAFELEQMRLENEKRVAELESELQSVKVDHLGQLIRKYGVNAGNMIEHVNGGMTGAQLSEAINKTIRENREDKLNMISTLYREGIISKSAAEETFTTLIGMDDNNSGSGMLETGKIEEEEKKTSKTESFKWNDNDTEDGTIE